MGPNAPNMFGRPPENVDPALQGISELNFPPAPAVAIAYPRFLDWSRLYNFHKNLGAAYTIDKLANELEMMRSPAPGQVPNSRIAWAQERHLGMRRSHENSLMAQLNEVLHRSTGKKIFEELNSSKHKARIFPFDFAPSRSWSTTILALTRPRDAEGSWLKDAPFGGRSFAGRSFNLTVGNQHTPADKYRRGTGIGSDSDIFFTPHQRQGAKSDDEILLHELVHACRYGRGVQYQMPMSGGYQNQEEFLAATIENMYRSEKKRPLVGYQKGAVDPITFLDSKLTPTPRLALALMRSKQPSLFAALAQLNIPFNPIRQVDAESKAALGRIEWS